jgi:hypothetical protein
MKTYVLIEESRARVLNALDLLEVILNSYSSTVENVLYCYGSIDTDRREIEEAREALHEAQSRLALENLRTISALELLAEQSDSTE